jgi:hypothetical protein
MESGELFTAEEAEPRASIYPSREFQVPIQPRARVETVRNCQKSGYNHSLRSREFIISWLNHTPHAPTVYASCSA